MTIRCEWRGAFENDEMHLLHAEAFDTRVFTTQEWIQDTMVAEGHRRLGVGQRLVAEAATGARAAGCDWLHVDFDPDLQRFYIDACGFRQTSAGLLALQD